MQTVTRINAITVIQTFSFLSLFPEAPLRKTIHMLYGGAQREWSDFTQFFEVEVYFYVALYISSSGQYTPVAVCALEF